MLEERSIQIRVGIFVMSGFILAAIIISMLGGERSWFERKYALHCRFDDANGLVMGAAVNLAGVKVGAVEAIHFPANPEERQIDVTLKIGKEYQHRIHRDSVASIHTQGLLGDKFINVTMGSSSAPVAEPGEYLPIGRSAGLATLAERGGEVLDKLDTVAGQMQELLGDRSKDSLVHTLFSDPRGKEMMNDLSQSMRALQRLTGRLDSEGTGDIVTNLRRASEDMRAITGQIRRGEGTVGGLLTDSAIYNDLRSLFGRANRSLLLKAIVRSTLRENDKKSIEP